ncbi:MAG: hypothetical protein WC992_05915 [Acholeplasmataceae bacterium]
MESRIDRDPANREHNVFVRVSDRELYAALRPEILLAHLQNEIVNRLADAVMSRVGPAMDKALRGEE